MTSTDLTCDLNYDSKEDKTILNSKDVGIVEGLFYLQSTDEHLLGEVGTIVDIDSLNLVTYSSVDDYYYSWEFY